MHPIVVILLMLVWAAVMWVQVMYVVPVLFAVTLAAAGVAALGLYYLHACRTLAPVTLAGPSPVAAPEISYRHYLLGQVWRDWWAITRTVVPRVRDTAGRVLSALTRTLVGGIWGFFLFPVWAALCAGIVVAAVPAAVFVLALTVLYGVVAAAWLGAWLACVLVLAAVERGFMAYGRILQTCPHPFCYERIGLPVYACPGCGALHPRLAPGPPGAFRHVCRCGARLPTTVPLGRFRLAAYCPHCGGRLPERIGRVRVEPLPFVGGPAAGKTTFMMLGIRALHDRARAARGRLAFVEPRHAQAYAGALREFERGGRLTKTGPELPLATMLDVELPGRARRILYLFDPAGEHYAGATEVESLRYLDHGEALLFIVDPFALPHVRRALTGDERGLVEGAAAASGEDPADTFQRVLNELRSRPDRGRQKRVAVVVTKTDLLARTEVGRRLGDVRDWLGGVGLGNTVRTLDQVAGEVRYFASGLAPGGPGAGVADLLGWVSGLPATPEGGPESGTDGGTDGGDGGDTAGAGGDPPGTVPLRAPWPVRGRGSGRVPVGYQAGRWAVLASLSVLTVTALTGAAVAAAGHLPY